MTYEATGQGLTGSVSETVLDNDGGGNWSFNRNYLVTYYLKITDAALLGTLTLIIRWNDGTANRTFTSTSLLLTGLNALNGSLVIKTSNNDPIPRPTFEIALAALSGSVAYDYRINADLQTS